jgi:class 3 adenylate cyclase
MRTLDNTDERHADAQRSCHRRGDRGLLATRSSARPCKSANAYPADRSSSPLRVLLFTDIVGSTALNVRVGDERFVRVWAEHSRMVHRAALDHEGHRFHDTGDGFGVWFGDARQAVACAFEIHQRLRLSNVTSPDAPLTVRIGLAAGHPVAHGSDLYGLAVVRAVRVCAMAGGGETLAASEVLSVEPLRDVIVDFAGRVLLKGFSEPTNVFALRPRRSHGDSSFGSLLQQGASDRPTGAVLAPYRG